MDCNVLGDFTHGRNQKISRPSLVKQPNLRKRGNMRGLVRQKQKVYWSRISEKTQGLDRIKVYEKPVLYSFSVSSTAGTPEEIAAGIVPDYDRYITSFNRNFLISAMCKIS